jgi:RimJ/RimL family protein N-acetyltransferase
VTAEAPARAADGVSPRSPLDPRRPELGTIALLPLDAETFGFGSADLRPGSPGAASSRDLAARLEQWAGEHGVGVVACRLPAGPGAPVSQPWLEDAGFRFVELQVRATLPRLDAAALPKNRLTVRHAEPADVPKILSMAGIAFGYGRYHADPRFPRALADARYRAWMERALADSRAGAWVGVVGPPGEPAGFAHAELAGDAADLRLLASDPSTPGPIGLELVVGALRHLAGGGARRATARLTPANTPALNVYASLSFRFHEPEIVLHWHRPGAPHLASGEPR